MFGFTIKKSFCDGWDNLFVLVFTNLIYLFVAMGLVSVVAFFTGGDNLLLFLTFTVACILLSILAMAFGDQAQKISDFCGVRFVDYFKNIPGVLKDGALLGLLIAIVTTVSVVGIPFYWTMGSTFGLCVAALFVWLDVIFLLAIQWFIPLRSAMHNPFKKCLKKCFIIFFDNTFFCLQMALYNLVMIIFSVLFLGFVPSMAGVILARTDALRLRLYKYDYLEEHPELKTKAQRSQIPWEELLYDDKEALGVRNFKSFFMPWKDSK